MNDERAALDQLLEVMHEHDLDALRVRLGETTYELVRRAERSAAAPPAQTAEPVAQAAVPAPPVANNYRKVTAPIVGVFYRSSAPGADAFVDVGDRVEIGQVLCILEAMKLMNEITSDFAGIVRGVLPENGALVSLGEEMFWIEP